MIDLEPEAPAPVPKDEGPKRSYCALEGQPNQAGAARHKTGVQPYYFSVQHTATNADARNACVRGFNRGGGLHATSFRRAGRLSLRPKIRRWDTFTRSDAI